MGTLCLSRMPSSHEPRSKPYLFVICETRSTKISFILFTSSLSRVGFPKSCWQAEELVQAPEESYEKYKEMLLKYNEPLTWTITRFWILFYLLKHIFDLKRIVYRKLGNHNKKKLCNCYKSRTDLIDTP